MRWARAVIGLAALVACASAASAQTYRGLPVPRRGSIEVGGGVFWLSGADGNASPAQLTRNSDVAAGPFDLFTARGRLDPAAGLQARLGFYLSPTIEIEAGLRYARPKLSYRLGGDAESAADVTARETMTHYVVEGSLVFHFARASFSRGRGIPFVSGGAGYLRELHQGNQLIETGTEYHATGGIKYWFDTRKRRLGVRGEGGISFRERGFELQDAQRTMPIVSGSLVYLF